MKKSSIFVRTTFIGFHHWPAAPKEVAFLRSLHRHVFHVEVHVKVSHGDRDVEFFTLKNQVGSLIEAYIFPELVKNPKQSCEMLAEEIWAAIENTYGHSVTKVVVSEDGENGATIEI